MHGAIEGPAERQTRNDPAEAGPQRAAHRKREALLCYPAGSRPNHRADKRAVERRRGRSRTHRNGVKTLACLSALGPERLVGSERTRNDAPKGVESLPQSSSSDSLPGEYFWPVTGTSTTAESNPTPRRLAEHLRRTRRRSRGSLAGTSGCSSPEICSSTLRAHRWAIPLWRERDPVVTSRNWPWRRGAKYARIGPWATSRRICTVGSSNSRKR